MTTTQILGFVATGLVIVEAHVTGSCADGFGGLRVLRAAGNDGSDS